MTNAEILEALESALCAARKGHDYRGRLHRLFADVTNLRDVLVDSILEGEDVVAASNSPTRPEKHPCSPFPSVPRGLPAEPGEIKYIMVPKGCHYTILVVSDEKLS